MDGQAPVSVDAGASGAMRPVSPPLMEGVDKGPSTEALELIATPLMDSTQGTQATLAKSTGTVLRGSFTSFTPAQQDEQRIANSSDLLTTPETETLASGGVVTPTISEKSANSVQKTGPREQNSVTAAVHSTQIENCQITGQQSQLVSEEVGQNGRKKMKSWFDILPAVLQNFKTQDREQIRQLMLPRCKMCKRGDVDIKAEITCNHEGCYLKDQALCSTCWKLTHSSESLRTHRHLSASICRQCQLERIAYWCAECDLQFCSQCFDQIHSVNRTKGHRNLATEDAPGPCVAKSHWSTNFQNVVFRMLAAQKHPARATNGRHVNNAGEKRKRDVEVIVIDDDEADENEVESTNCRFNVLHADKTTRQQFGSNDFALDQPTQARDIMTERLFSCRTAPALQTPRQTSSTFSLPQGPVAQPSIVEPMPFSQELIETPVPSLPEAISTGSGDCTPTLKETNTFNNNAGNYTYWNNSAPQCTTVSSVENGISTTPFATRTVSNEVVQVPSAFTAIAEGTTNGVWPTSPAIVADMASTSNSKNYLPLGGAFFAENALVDSLVDRYHEVNQNVTNMELQSDQLTRQIAVATCQGPYTAAPIMALLSKLQPIMEAARLRRDKLLIAMIVQSSDIMNSVRLLRMTELGDVPQVPMISHRKCLQISNEINQHKTKLIELNHYLSDSLSQSHALSTSHESSLIRTTSAQIRMLETKIKKLKKAREVEIVRIVQFSVKIREDLKQVFQRTVNMQRQQQQRP